MNNLEYEVNADDSTTSEVVFNPKGELSFESGNSFTAIASDDTETSHTAGSVAIVVTGSTCNDNSGNFYLPADGSIVDKSGNNHSFTNNGVTRTAEHQFGTGSLYFDGSDYLTLPVNPDWQFGTGDFTIDFWVKRSGTNIVEPLIHTTDPYGKPITLYIQSDDTVRINCTESRSHSWYFFTSTTTIGTTWTHLAYIRESSSVKLYINGVQETLVMSNGQYRSTYSVGGAYPCNIGANTDASSFFTGHIDSFRITKGVALWSDDFDLDAQALKYPAFYTYTVSSITPALSAVPASVRVPAFEPKIYSLGSIATPVPDAEADTTTVYSIGGNVTVNGSAASKRIEVMNRNTMERLFQTSSNASGAWAINRVPEMTTPDLFIAAFDDEGDYNAEVADFVTPYESTVEEVFNG